MKSSQYNCTSKTKERERAREIVISPKRNKCHISKFSEQRPDLREVKPYTTSFDATPRSPDDPERVSTLCSSMTLPSSSSIKPSLHAPQTYRFTSLDGTPDHFRHRTLKRQRPNKPEVKGLRPSYARARRTAILVQATVSEASGHAMDIREQDLG
ncbi:hypothetical protein BU26DRAFT_276036 [Trematosphaeria pertusa]|uniref:Uncharacterized protein n=1 Tax=Trematosphaeria pertusa TaxID=390896 RepID=A0A6A6ILX6_9PLEO|nr:uncharacterized protein BU26DRAFT_276036 [Trematosphaeria pertusa]KAF2251078.1 hypothetical protein BU26DRAFT_276036 [Trematosphaeria pertusa]